ncbi:hypothetical protein AO259_03635 [Pseudomonas sp. ICMP 564]|nr:hypothetical protein AO259_03635 [Pseudomonas sp. ICMP 564]
MRRFGCMVERIFRDFYSEIFSSHSRLATQARCRLKAPRPVKVVFFQIVGLVEAIKTFTNDAVAGGTGVHATTGTFDLDVVVMGNFKKGLAGLSLHDHAIRAMLGVR